MNYKIFVNKNHSEITDYTLVSIKKLIPSNTTLDYPTGYPWLPYWVSLTTPLGMYKKEQFTTEADNTESQQSLTPQWIMVLYTVSSTGQYFDIIKKLII